jgi:hypothetical protein
MTKRSQAVQQLKSGATLDKIAAHMGVSFQTIVRYMRLQVAEGAVRFSDVFFGLCPKRRALLAECLERSHGIENKMYYKEAAELGISWDEANLFVSLKDSPVFRGDMYEYVADIELQLHDFIRNHLVLQFGDAKWWRTGVPLSVRKYAAAVREEDPDATEDLFCYTTFINLSEILDKNWALLSTPLPSTLSKDKKKLLSDMNRLNQIRNAVMHPVKKKRWTLDDFEFVKQFRQTIKGIKPAKTGRTKP